MNPLVIVVDGTLLSFFVNFLIKSDPLMTMEDFALIKHFENLDEESRELVRKAEDSVNLAYAPYSKFRVGAAILLDNGAVVLGANQENAAYPDGMCAERVALFAMTSLYSGRQIRKMAVVARREGTNRLTPVTCCGSCRRNRNS